MGFGFWGLGFRVWGFGFGVWGFGFRVLGFGFPKRGVNYPLGREGGGGPFNHLSIGGITKRYHFGKYNMPFEALGPSELVLV